MTAGIAHQLATLQRIAAYSAGVRGHEVGEWHMGENFAVAGCIRCGAEVRVYFPALQPEMDGSTLEQPCKQHAIVERAA
jgi:hypothetical protein